MKSNNKISNGMFDNSASINTATFNDYFKRLKLLTLSLFEWSNLPETISVRYLEETLFSEGKILFFKSDKYGFLALKCNVNGSLNFYNEAIQYNVITHVFNETVEAKDSVLIRNNYEELSTTSTINLFAQRLYEVERTIDINIKAQKTPIIILCDETERLTMKNMYMQYDGNYPFIFGDKKLDMTKMKVLQTEAPYNVDKLSLYKARIWNEALTFLGINNANTDKKERLITNEVTANDEQVEMSALTMLLTRQEACSQINEKFGLNVSVNLRKYYIRYLQENEVYNE